MNMWAVLALAAGAAADEYLPGWYQQAFSMDSFRSYYFNLYLGTPPQMVSVYLDFGSADFFVAAGANSCANVTCSEYEMYPYFNNNDSSTIVHSGSFFTSSLSSDSLLVSAEWVTDNILFQNVSLNDSILAFHDASIVDEVQGSYGTSSYIQTTSQVCILGIGPRGLEETVQWVYNGSPGPTYDNFLYQLPGVSPSYSIWVNPATYTDGVITFGALDTSQFESGSLVAVPIVNENNLWSSLIDPVYLGVALFSLSVNLQVAQTEWVNQTLVLTSDVAILDSKANFSMPQMYLQQLGAALSAVWSGSQGMYLVNCDLQAEIVLDISGFNFIVSLQEQLIPYAFNDERGQSVCALNIGVSKNVILSNNVLRNYYLAVDYVAKQVAFGTAVTSGAISSASTVLVQNSIPYATQAPLYQYSQVATGSDISIEITYAPTGLVLPASLSTSFVLGGTPAPSVETLIYSDVATRSMAKATEASNRGAPAAQSRGLWLAMAAVLSVTLPRLF